MKKLSLIALVFTGFFIAIGCDSKSETKSTEKKATAEAGHHGWWCDEHGVKESECSMCSAKVAKACMEKGDWCKEHERAKSQCFICDPKLKEKFAADYVAKYGKQPPEPEGQMPEAKK